MRTVAFLLLMGSLSLTGFACAINPALRMPSSEEIRNQLSGEIQLNLLDQGRAIAIADCADCHRQYWPAEYSSRRWPSILREMGSRASLSPQEIDAVTAYMTHASDLTTREAPVTVD